MEELLMELLGGEFEMQIMDDWQPLQQEDIGWWDRYWLTGKTHL
jgi:hypothetical protein